MIKVMEKLYLVSPLYLGDAFVINALVHRWAAQAHEVHVPTLPVYVATVQCLYAHVPNVKVVPYLGADHEQEYIRSHALQVINFRTLYEMHQLPIKHHDSPVSVPVNWDRQIYEYFDVPYSVRYREFQLPATIPHTEQVFEKLNPTQEPYVLWHGESDTMIHKCGINLHAWRQHIGAPDYKVIHIQPGVTANLLSYMKLIEHAQEIHCIPSAFHALVDSVTHKTSAKLFFHDVKLHTIMQVNSRWNSWRWHSVYYDHKI